jgi:hypothetical protein
VGWNEAEVSLLPPTWLPDIRESPKARTADGKPVKIVGEQRDPSAAGAGCPVSRVERWLESRGFSQTKHGEKYTYWHREDVQVFLAAEGEELISGSLRFTLSRESPARWAAWQELVNDLCQAADLALVDAEKAVKVGPEELFRLLGRTTSWREFENHFQWPSVVAASR